MYHPSREEFVRAATQGNLIPVYRELCADTDTPVSAYAALGDGDHSFLLESVVGGATWAAYSFVGVAPRAVITCRGGVAHATWYDVEGGGAAKTAEWPAADPIVALSEVMGEFRPAPSVLGGLPRFWGGAVGWISYDCVRAFEDLPARRRTQPLAALGLPTLCMAISDTVVVFDNLRQTIKVVATGYVPRPEKAGLAYDRACERIDEIIARLRGPRPRLRALAPLPAEVAPSLGSATSRFGQLDFEGAVEQIKDYILAGDAFQVVLSQRLDVPRAGVDPLDVYRSLRVINPSPYMFHLRYPEATVTGASPETLVRLDGGTIELRPIAGTRPRGATRSDDVGLEEELRADPKERAEHLMLIDLGRNDVGRVAATGTVRVTEQMVVERYSHVMHLVSHVVGELGAGRAWPDVLRAAFPAGTLSGAPKIRAMEIIDELEPTERGLYGGAVGYVSFTGNMDLAIAIRTLVTLGDTIHVQAGAGIVADSDPTREWEETMNKAGAVLRAVAMAAQPEERGS
jgi:anthranilate synthase component 1